MVTIFSEEKCFLIGENPGWTPCFFPFFRRRFAMPAQKKVKCRRHDFFPLQSSFGTAANERNQHTPSPKLLN
jgi:hypothetical protein